MSLDTGDVTVDEWVIHQIPKVFTAGSTKAAPTLSEAISPYDVDVARFFERKVSESFARSRHQIDSDSSRNIPGQIRNYLVEEDPSLVELSKELANHLVASQSGSMSAGLLVTMGGAHANDKFIAILKLEKEEGARAVSADVEGKTTYNVEYLRDLFLTGKTRVFKVAVFFSLKDADETLEGWASDPQSRGSEIADFFLETFLQCTLHEDPRVATRIFHTESEKFLNEKIQDGEKRARYEIALVAELNNNSHQVSLKDFARNNLDLPDRDAFVSALTTAGVQDNFIKNIDDIKSRLRKVQYETDGGVKVSVPEQAQDLVTVENADGGRTEIRVVDTLKKLSSRG
ncbi:hypothetical protein RN2511_042270 [Rhodococcus sp. NKCM2511]|uniref:nucleoid-associated protein n=1 Tax=Rhodococcus sp. NKCM2511 TaxID=2766011 RepID=UPI001910F2BD|nr:nucleoid-associated protein [Rhodococcus sp. NKCM2511]GHP19491.1 hypothetical protein RN2511_042270 [Rhodococcus sp. NKCM2511]